LKWLRNIQVSSSQSSEKTDAAGTAGSTFLATIGVCASLGDPRRSLSAVATKFLPGCQGDLTTDACDRTYDVDAAITGYGHNAVSRGGQLGLAALQRQIDELKRPIPVIMLYPFTNHA
jgi:hypothetical protein